MDDRFFELYGTELHHLRTVAADFARLYPDRSKTLCLNPKSADPADPYVERLLEGCAFLTARIQAKFEEQFPRITHTLLENLVPQYLAPTPAMTIVRFEPRFEDAGLAEGPRLERHTELTARLPRNQETRCVFRTAHEVRLWPIKVVSADYRDRDLPGDLAQRDRTRAAITLRLRVTADLGFDALEGLDHLTFYLTGGDEMAVTLYEQIFAHCIGVDVRPTASGTDDGRHPLDASAIKRVGFDDEHALFPATHRGFQGYRLLREYFALPQRFLFFRVESLGTLTRKITAQEIELVLLLDKELSRLEGLVNGDHFALYCTPAINVFPRTARVPLSDRYSEYQVIVDRTRPRDYEVFEVRGVEGRGKSAEERESFFPFYASKDQDEREQGRRRAYFSTYRTTPELTQHERKRGPRSKYLGSELFVSLVEATGGPHRSELKNLAVETLCTNRDLTLLTPFCDGQIDFPTVSAETGSFVLGAYCMVDPTSPRASYATGAMAWRLVSHLSLNYLSLVNDPEGGDAKSLRALLQLYAGHTSQSDPDRAFEVKMRQIIGVQSVETEPVVDRVHGAMVQGRRIFVTFDESHYGGWGIFVLGAVLEQFFAKYASINSFTQTVVRSRSRGTVMTWPMRTGRRHVI